MKVLGLILSLAAAPVAAADVIHFTTEDYPPYNFRAGNDIKGAGYDQLIVMMEELKIPYSVEMMPWARAIALMTSLSEFDSSTDAAGFPVAGVLASSRSRCSTVTTAKASGATTAAVPTAPSRPEPEPRRSPPRRRCRVLG